MDNLTHSLVGAALAHAALPPAPSPGRRRLFVAAGVLAANLPDVDLLYFRITPPPLGYLLHHRGHTHTIVGILAQGVFLALLCRAAPPLRRLAGPDLRRLFWLLTAALASHLLLDAGNSYGVHPFHPLGSRWYYGDAVFILEPWLWVLLGVPVAWNAVRRLSRVSMLALVALLVLAMVRAGVVPAGPALAVGSLAVALAWGVRRRSFVARAAAALALSTLYVAALLALSAVARARTRELLEPVVRGQIVDVVLNPNPADPLCWMAIAVEKDEAGGAYALHRGTLSLVPGWRPATACASFRLLHGAVPAVATPEAAWDEPIRQSLEALRQRAGRDCWVRAWLQFGRAPVLGEGVIYDLRFERGAGDNFTTMTLRPDPGAGGCPSPLTGWDVPRADLLGPAAEAGAGPGP